MYIPHSDEDIKSMLNVIGKNSTEELFENIPQHLKSATLNLGEAKSESDVASALKQISQHNQLPKVSFLGAGFYDHYIPAAVDAIVSDHRFYTAYTPYQPEASQGWLKAIFEYQTFMCELTGLDVSNASVYDGATAMAEAALMVIKHTGRNKIILDSAVNFTHKQVLRTYAEACDFEIYETALCFPLDSEVFLRPILSDDSAAVILQNPDFFGRVNDFTNLIESAHAKGMLAIMSVYPISLGKVKTPAEMGADIAIGDGQSLGSYLSMGGMNFGFICCKKELQRRMPGRIVGQTIDKEGKTAYVLTLQAREQHIRREKATSNICSNQAHSALRASVYLSLLGKKGLFKLADEIHIRVSYLKNLLSKVPRITFYDYPVFNEFVVGLPINAEVFCKRMMERNINPGFPLGVVDPEYTKNLLITVTEKTGQKEIESFIRNIEDVL